MALLIDRRQLAAGAAGLGVLGWAGAASAQSSRLMRDLAATSRARRAAARAGPLEIPFAVDQNTPWTRVQFEGGEPMPFMLDINATIVQAHPSAIEGLGLVAQRRSGDVTAYDPIPVIMAGVRTSPLSLITNAKLFEGRIAQGSLPLMAFDMPFELDWDEKTLRFGVWPEDGAQAWTTLSGRAQSWQWPVIQAVLDGEPVNLAVETEISSGVTLFPPYFERRGLWDRYARRRTDMDQYGEPFAQIIVADHLRFGELELREPLVRLKRGWDVFEAQHGIRTAGGPDGVIGFDMLKRFNLRCNSRADVFSMQPSQGFAAPYLDDRAGLVLTLRNGDAVISAMDSSSPAFRAGLRKGDIIVAHHAPGGLSSLAWAVTQPAGNRVEISYLRADQPEQRATIILEDRV